MTAFTPVPTDLDTVLSTSWLTEALQGAYPGVAVGEARDVGHIESTALKVRIVVEYSDRAGYARRPNTDEMFTIAGLLPAFRRGRQTRIISARPK